MAHALRRISFATCDPGKRRFSFLAREPGSGKHPQFCHSFRTTTPAQAEELSRLLGNAFRMAYAHQLQPAFLELLGQSKVVNNANHHHHHHHPQSAPPSVKESQLQGPQRRPETNGNFVQETSRSSTPMMPKVAPQSTTPPNPSTPEKIWAKTAVIKHHEPLFAGLLQQGSSGGSSTPLPHLHSSPQHPLAGALRPTHLSQPGGSSPPGGRKGSSDADLWSPGSNSSCEDNTKLASPTEDNNSCSQVIEKPPLVKTLHEAWMRPCGRAGISGTSGDQPTPPGAVAEEAYLPRPSPHRSGTPATATGVDSFSPPASPVHQQQQRPTQMPLAHQQIQEAAAADSGATSNSGTSHEETQKILSPRRDVRPRVLQVSLPTIPDAGSTRNKSHQAGEDGLLSEDGFPGLLSASSCSSSEASSKRGSSASSSSTSDNNFVTDSEPSTPCKKKGGYAPPSPPERMDSLSPQQEAEEKELRGAPWFQAGIPREIALEILGQEPQGSFMVRESTTKPGCYALSLRVPRDFQPTGIAHYLILRTAKGYKIKGFTKEFTTLTSLITHHSVMPELLPCPLSLSRYNPVFRKQDTSQDLVDIEQDPDYNLLADFRKVMATPDLKV